MRLRHLVVLCGALALTVGAATALAGGGNSANAKLCQKGGWRNFVRSDGSSFANEGDCVSYGAKGGTLTPKTQWQRDCESYGGTFGTGPSTFYCFQWFAGTPGEYSTRNAVLSSDCSYITFGTIPDPSPPYYSSFCTNQGA
jgi:hypothetical protein